MLLIALILSAVANIQFANATIVIDLSAEPESALRNQDHREFLDGKISKVNLALSVWFKAAEICKKQRGLNLGARSFLLNPRSAQNESDFSFRKIECFTPKDQEVQGLDMGYVNYALFKIRKSLNPPGPPCPTEEPEEDPYQEISQQEWDAVDFVVSPIGVDFDQMLKNDRDRLWVDLLPTDQYALGDQYRELSDLIQSYHALQKDLPENTLVRIEKLELITRIAEESSKQNIRPALKLIFQTAKNKAKYLRELLALPEEAHKRNPKNIPKGLLVRGIDEKYRPQWIQHLDPGLRGSDLEPYYQLWLGESESSQIQETDKKIARFFYWLENFSDPEREFNQQDPLHRAPEKRRIFFNADGTAYSDFFGNPIRPFVKTPLSRDNGYTYIIDEEGNLYINNQGNHGEIKRGSNVISAGIIHFENGKISYLDNSSGHYTPSNQHLDQAIRVLKTKFGENIFATKFEKKYWTADTPRTKPIFSTDLPEILKKLDTLTPDQQEKKGTLYIQSYGPDKREEISFSDFRKRLTDISHLKQKQEQKRKELDALLAKSEEPSWEREEKEADLQDIEMDIHQLEPWTQLTNQEMLHVFEEEGRAKKLLNEFTNHIQPTPETEKAFVKAQVRYSLLPATSLLELNLGHLTLMLKGALLKLGSGPNPEKNKLLLQKAIQSVNNFNIPELINEFRKVETNNDLNKLNTQWFKFRLQTITNMLGNVKQAGIPLHSSVGAIESSLQDYHNYYFPNLGSAMNSDRTLVDFSNFIERASRFRIPENQMNFSVHGRIYPVTEALNEYRKRRTEFEHGIDQARPASVLLSTNIFLSESGNAMLHSH